MFTDQHISPTFCIFLLNSKRKIHVGTVPRYNNPSPNQYELVVMKRVIVTSKKIITSENNKLIGVLSGSCCSKKDLLRLCAKIFFLENKHFVFFYSGKNTFPGRIRIRIPVSFPWDATKTLLQTSPCTQKLMNNGYDS